MKHSVSLTNQTQITDWICGGGKGQNQSVKPFSEVWRLGDTEVPGSAGSHVDLRGRGCLGSCKGGQGQARSKGWGRG